MRLAAGTRLGPYDILSALGSGGMGEVYRARDTKLGREVAIKVLGEAMAKDPKGLARFMREVHAVAALNPAHRGGRRDVGAPYARPHSLEGVFAQSGKPSEASALHGELLERSSHTYVPLAHLALTAEAAGQHEGALAFARRAWDEREPPFILHARHFPEYRTLRSDPRFATILREMNEPV
jgi:hypothetical protein